jgi:hypothetical protein
MKVLLKVLEAIAVALLVIGFLCVLRMAWDLNRFKQCHDTEFTLPYCEYYKNY